MEIVSSFYRIFIKASLILGKFYTVHNNKSGVLPIKILFDALKTRKLCSVSITSYISLASSCSKYNWNDIIIDEYEIVLVFLKITIVPIPI